MIKVRGDLQVDGLHHEGQSAEDYYASKLHLLSLTEGEVQDGYDVLKALLFRCTLWIEIMREK